MAKNILVFDTETIDLQKRFCYNLGYVIVNIADGKIVCKRDFVIEQIYRNKELMHTAYYANKLPLYVRKMKGRKAKKVMWGEACRQMCKDIQDYQVADGYAYNAGFDIKVMDYNHNFYKNKRKPLDKINVYDIMKYIDIIVQTEDYYNFCIKNNFISSVTGLPSKSAETMFAYLTNNPNYKEEHTALEDSKIEKDILLTALAFEE